MGGRGGSSGLGKSGRGIRSGALQKNAEVVTIETSYRRKSIAGSHYEDSVLKATETSDGKIVFSYADGYFKNDRPKANSHDVIFYIKHGAVIHFNNKRTKFYGINWDNVKSVSGQTFDIKSHLKEKGFHWDREKKMWIKE